MTVPREFGCTLDARRPELHVHSPGVDPGLGSPVSDGIEVLYLTPTGVAVTTQLFENPYQPDEDAQRWETFRSRVADDGDLKLNASERSR